MLGDIIFSIDQNKHEVNLERKREKKQRTTNVKSLS